GAALGALVEQGTVAREEIVVASKAGFLSFDGEVPADPRAYFMEEYVSRGIVKPEEVVGGMHCLAPRYLEDQIERSRRNLRLETVDIYYLHNPETQLQAVPRAEFLRRMRAAFETREAAVAAGKIRCYGLATWTGFRGPPAGRDSLGLQELVKLAEQVAGPEHHFKVVQLPYNLAMPEAFALRNQPLAGETVSVLEAARRLGLTVFASASIMQGQVAVNLLAELRAQLNGGLDTDAQRGLQFVRSTPGIGAALVGMRRLEHVEENLRLLSRALAPPEAIRQLFSA
ncbi:MAG: aldo/keto reductase, partial [Terriglobia bacterium]